MFVLKINTVRKIPTRVVVVEKDDECRFLSESDLEMDARANKAVASAIAESMLRNKPVARYDIDKRRVYMEYSNGRREYV